jgi:membrane-associated phospholipid phosphatase
MQAYLAVMLASYAVFVLYPTIGPRPPVVAGGGFAAWCLRLVYALDAPYNCFPSLHVAYAFVAALTCDRVNRTLGIVAIAWATLIGISTLYTKQHYVADVIAGAAEGWLACTLFLRGYPRRAVAETDRRLAPRRAMIAAGIFAVMVAGFWIAFALETRR